MYETFSDLVGTCTISDKKIIFNVLDVALGAGYRLIGKFIEYLYKYIIYTYKFMCLFNLQNYWNTKLSHTP